MSADSHMLFDIPGPRGRRRIAVITALSVLLLAWAGYQAVHQFATHGQLAASQWDIFAQWPIEHYLLTGLTATLEATAAAAALSMPLGALVALARLASRRWLSWPAAVYTEVFRSIPVLLLIYICLLGLPKAGLTMPEFWQLVVPVVLCSSATTAEIFRAGVLALHRGQTEAAQALGLGYWQTTRIIVLPQVIRSLLPLLVTQLVNILKETTLGGVVSYVELLESAKTLGEYTHTLVQTYLIVALIYMLTNAALSRVAHGLERRQRSNSRLRSPARSSGGEPTPLLSQAAASSVAE